MIFPNYCLSNICDAKGTMTRSLYFSELSDIRFSKVIFSEL